MHDAIHAHPGGSRLWRVSCDGQPFDEENGGLIDASSSGKQVAPCRSSVWQVTQAKPLTVAT
ncbi:hypothetical protein VRK_20700 [Vibrio sp. MEBiC08052]|nr:hypothetical protein VRK_20700 [Vibrio sp. MEBiC08052]